MPVQRFAQVVGAVWLLASRVGTSANILALNTPDHFPHLATAALALYFGLAGRRSAAPTAPTT